jgi:hypothetical protein
LRKKLKDDNEPPNLSSSSTIKEKNVENDNKLKCSLLFSTNGKKKTKDDNELGSQLVVVINN